MRQFKIDEYGLNSAADQSKFSKDPSTKVGAVVLRDDGTLAAAGWNGFACGIEDTQERLDDRGMRLLLTVHAEENAIIHSHESLRGKTMYVWPFMPCSRCTSRIIQAGITRVVAPASRPERWENDMAFAESLFAEAGVELDLVDTVNVEA